MKPFKTNDLASLSEVLAKRSRATVTENYNDRVRQNAPKKGGVKPPANTMAERLKREEQGKRITKLCAIIKRAEPRLLMELLQTFGSIEGLSAPKQAELIQRLESIRKEYSL